MISEFLEHLQARKYSPITVEISKKWLEHFTARYPEPDQLKPADLTRYHKSLHWEPGPSGKLYSQNTVNQAIGVIRAYLRWCVEQGYLKTSPASHLKTRGAPKTERVYLTTTQARKLLSLPDLGTPLGLRDRAALGLVVEVQAPPGALARLNLSDFQPDTGAVLLKSRKRRIVDLGKGLQADLERYIRLGRQGQAQHGENALFVSSSGKRLSTSAFQEILRKYCRRADVPKPPFFS